MNDFVRAFQAQHYRRNLILICLLFSGVFFNYLMIKYLANTTDQIYLSALLTAVSELFAYGVFGSCYEKFGMKVTFRLSFII